MVIIHADSEDAFKKEVEESKKPVIVDFWAEWCGPCRILGPIFEDVSKEVGGVKFVKVDIDKAEEVAAKFNIMSIPTLIIMKDGEVVQQQSGVLTADQLKDFIEDNK